MASSTDHLVSSSDHLSSSLCSILHSLVTLSLLGPNILLSTVVSNTFSLHFCYLIPLRPKYPRTPLASVYPSV
jgi:hypothetical protein